MLKPNLFSALLAALLCLPAGVSCQALSGGPRHFKALKLTPAPQISGTWGILERDGGNRTVAPYLSSLAGGETGTGIIVSPDFTLSADKIEFAICGHDGQGGGQGKNIIVLVDADSGEILRKTPAPGNDAMQPRSWDVKDLRGRKVRVEVRDGVGAAAFAWLGVARISAGTELNVDFQKGLPDGWKAGGQPREHKARRELIQDGIPFLAMKETMVPSAGAAEVPCGFTAKRIYILGCTVYDARPLSAPGSVEIAYRDGARERFPLMVGFTLEGAFKLLSKSKAMHLHPSGDPFQYYLVLAPRDAVIEKIELRRDSAAGSAPWISAITCETTAESENLEDLPAAALSSEEAAWIEAHAISASSPDMRDIARQIRKGNHIQE